MNNQKDIAQGFVFLQGKLNTATVEDQIKKVGSEPKKTVFIFPGNSGHHKPSSTLFSIKGGLGLATVAKNVGSEGLPTLSLPTRDVDSSKGIPTMSKTAVADLWRAVGYGFSLALPVREKDSFGEIFENTFKDTTIEPSFWGDTVKISDTGLAKYYLEELEILRNFLDGTSVQKEQILVDLQKKFPEAYASYQAGEKALKSDTPPDWFKPNDQQPIAKKVIDTDISVMPPAPTTMPKESRKTVKTEPSKKLDSVKKSENSSANPLLEYHLKETERLINLHRPTTISEILEIQKLAAANTEVFFAKLAQANAEKPATSQQEYDWGPVVLDNSKPPTISLFTDEKGKIFTDEGHKFAIEARSGKNELNNLQNRHITPIAMLKRHVKKLLLEGRTIEEASKIVLDISEIILEDLRKFSNTGEKTIVTREEIISKFFDYFKSNPERLTGDKNKDDFIIVFQRLFSTYAMAPYGVLPTEGNTPEPENEMHMVRKALDVFERFEAKVSKNFALQEKIATGELSADEEEVKKSFAENTLQDEQLEEIANELFKIFDYKALPAETKKAREEAIFSTTSIKKTTEAQNYFPESLQKSFEDYAANQEKKLKEKLLADNPKFTERNKKATDFQTKLADIKKAKKIADPILFQTEGLKSFPKELGEAVKTTAKELKINIDAQKYSAQAIVDSWRHEDEPLERLYELTARHLGLFFLFTPNLQDEYQTDIINKFLDKVYYEHNARLALAGIDREKFGDIMWNKLLDKYPYFYDFQYKPEQRESQFAREGMLEQMTDFYVDNYHETLLSFPVSEETTKELPEPLQKMPFEKIQKDIEAAQEKHQQALDKFSDPNDKVNYLETQLASLTRMQHLLSRKSKEGIKERQLKLLQAELETLNERMEDEDVSKKRDRLEKEIKVWQEPIAMVSEDLAEKIKTLQQQLETFSKLFILTKYTLETLVTNTEKKDITEIREELEATIGAESIMYSEDVLSQLPTEMQKYPKQAPSTLGQFYYGPLSPTPTSEDEDYNSEDSSSSYSSLEDEEDWEIEFDDLSIQKQENLNLPKAIPTLGDGNCAFNAMALGIADLVRANQFSEINASDSLNHRRTEFYTLLQEKLELEAPTQEAFQSWLKNESDLEIQKNLAPLMRKFVVDKIRENNEYDTNYKENYETTSLGAFDGFLNGRMAEDDTFVVHDFIKVKFESLISASLPSLSNANDELLEWWRTEGKEQYFNSLSQPASGAWDTEKWASDVEPGALALALGINLTREKTNFDPAVFGPGNGLIPIDKEDLLEAEIFNFLRDAGFGYEYQGYFRLADSIKSNEDLERLVNKASDKVFEFLKNFELGDGKSYNIGKSIDKTTTDQHVFEELRARGLLNIDNGSYYLVTPNKSQIDTALNGLGNNQELKDKIFKHFHLNTPNITIKHGGGHWTYIRLPNMRKILEPNNSTNKSILEQQELKDYTETIQAEAKLDLLKIESSTTEMKMSSSSILEQKKLIDYLIENNINFNRNELEIHLDPIETQKLISIIKPVIQEAQKALEKTANILASFQLSKPVDPNKTKKRKFEGDISTIAEEDYLNPVSEEVSDDSSQQSNFSHDREQTKKRKFAENAESESSHTLSIPTSDIKDSSHHLAEPVDPNKTKKRKFLTDSESEGFASEEDNTWRDSEDEIMREKKRGKTRNTQSDFSLDRKEAKKRKFEGDISTIAEEDYSNPISEEVSNDSSQQSNFSHDREQTKKRKFAENAESESSHTLSIPTSDIKDSSHHITNAKRYEKSCNHSTKWQEFDHKIHEDEIVDTEKSATKPSTGITSSTEMQVESPSNQTSTVTNNESASESMQEEGANNLLHFSNTPTFGKR